MTLGLTLANVFTGEERCKFLVRLFEYIPGELLQGKPCSPQLCYSVGQTAARIDKALMVGGLQYLPYIFGLAGVSKHCRPRSDAA